MCARAGFWRVSEFVAPAANPQAVSAKIVAVIPARDEAAVIGDTVRSLLQQQFAGSLHLIVVDDGSTDGTARAALQAAQAVQSSDRLQVLSGTQPPTGWTGKLWAMSQGVTAAAGMQPDYLLLTDADIHHDQDNVARLLSIARAGEYSLVSFMVQLSVATLAERSLIPAFVFFFFLLYPPRATATRSSRTAGAAGGCMLLQPQALERIGGLQSIQSQLIDDCALARAIKRSGGLTWLGLTRRAHSTRQYGSFAEVGRMISRSAFYQLKHSWWLLLGTILGFGPDLPAAAATAARIRLDIEAARPGRMAAHERVLCAHGAVLSTLAAVESVSACDRDVLRGRDAAFSAAVSVTPRGPLEGQSSGRARRLGGVRGYDGGK